MKKYLFLPILFLMGSYHALFANFYNAQTLILENGFKFVFVKNPRVERSAHYSLIYNVGARDEDSELHKTGLAHFLEHLMFHGTKLYPPNVYEEIIYKAGGNQNAATGLDYTKYHATIHKNKLIELLKIEADRMQHLDIQPEAFKNEKLAVLEEISGAFEADLLEPYRQGVRDHLYNGHPYQRLPSGIRQDVMNLTIDDAYNFYRKYYQPCNATLYIEANLDFDDISQQVNTIFAPLQNNAPIIRQNINLNPPLNKELYIHRSKSQENAHFNRIYRLPIGDLRDKAALELLCSFLNFKSCSFSQCLIDQKKITNNLGILFNSDQKDFWIIEISFIFDHKNFELNQLNEIIDQAFTKILESKDINEAKLSEIRKADEYNEMCILTVFPSYDHLFTQTIASGQPIENLESSLVIEKELTYTDIKNSLKTLINNKEYLTSCILPQ